MPVNTRILRYLTAIEKYGSISEAAKRLYISQPYLSKILHDTEEEFHITIFTRSRGGLNATEAGRRFLDMSRELIHEEDRFVKAFRSQPEQAVLRIAAFPSSYPMDAFLRMLQEKPELSYCIHYKEESTIDVIQDIHSLAADLGIIFLKQNHAGLAKEFFKTRKIVCRRILDTELHVIVRSGHPLASAEHLELRELYSYPIVMYDSKKGTGIYTIEDGFYNSASLSDLVDFDRFRQVLYIYSRATMHNILTQTDAIAFGSQAVMEQEKNFGLCSLPFPFPDSAVPEEYGNSLFFIFRNDRPLPALGETYLEYLNRYYG